LCKSLRKEESSSEDSSDEDPSTICSLALAEYASYMKKGSEMRLRKLSDLSPPRVLLLITIVLPRFPLLGENR